MAREPAPLAAESLGVRRDQFDVPADVAYFNTASLCPLTHRVREVMSRVFRRDARALGLRVIYDVSHNTAKLERHVVTKIQNGLQVVALRVTLLDGSGAVLDLGAAKFAIFKSYR